METTTGIIIPVIAKVLTNILDSTFFESLPLPLLQLTGGFLLGVFSESMFELEPDIFMALVIASYILRIGRKDATGEWNGLLCG
jgi:hypothetical protein